MYNTLLFIGTTLPSIFAWIGSISYLIAYLLLSTNKVRADRKLYHVLNILGASGLTYNAIFLKDFPNIIVNIAWGIIACWAIRLIGRRKQNSDG